MRSRAVGALEVRESVPGVPALHEFPHGVFSPFVVETVPFAEPVIPSRLRLFAALHIDFTCFSWGLHFQFTVGLYSGVRRNKKRGKDGESGMNNMHQPHTNAVKTAPVLAVVLLVFVMLAGPFSSLMTPCTAGERVTVSWEEFKKLYRESVTRELKEAQPEEKEPQVYSIEEARYRLAVDGESAEGQVLLTGKVIKGDTAPIPLFGSGLVISSLDNVTGGSLLTKNTGKESISFLPSEHGTFQVACSFYLQVEEDTRSRYVDMEIPPALQNTLELKFSDESRPIEVPGIKNNDGLYHFSSGNTLTVRFARKKDVAQAALIDVDTVSIVRLQGKRTFITSHFLPRQAAGPRSFVLRLQAGSHFVTSSLNRSWIKSMEDGSYQITLPATYRNTFHILSAVDTTGAEDRFTFTLPSIDDNDGAQGGFILEEPDDGEISLSARGLVSRLPLGRLAPELQSAVKASNARHYMQVPVIEAVTVSVKRFVALKTPPVVLESIYFFTSFEENGGQLSVLKMDIPHGLNSQLNLKGIPGARVWALTVNGRRQKLYTREDNTWIIPLARGETSSVELAFIRDGVKLGLEGRLETDLPETGLTARKVHLGLALPQRVQLISVEGSITQSENGGWNPPREFIGQPFFFTRTFYQGETMKVALYYKEPVSECWSRTE